MSTTSRWTEIVELFEDALEHPRESQKSFVEQRSKGDRELRDQVLALLRADAEATNSLLRSSPGALGLPEVMNDNLPSRIGPYKVIEVIGRGGMGAVFLARRDRDFSRVVAIKTLRGFGQSEKTVARFRRERDILSKLEHPNIARLYGGGYDPAVGLFLVMEFVDGMPIDRYCQREKLEVSERLRIFTKVCEAVSYAHRNLIIHRDLKPSNVMVDKGGQVRLLDFGIAKWAEGRDRSEMSTLAGGAMTPAYASPEQFLGKPVTTSSDIYSLGVVLYELLTGARPWEGTRNESAEHVESIINEVPRYPSELVGESVSTFSEFSKSLRGDVDKIVLKALAKLPEDRYMSVDAFADDIGLHLRGRPIKATSGRLGYVARKFIRRNRTVVAMFSGALALVLLTVSISIKSANQYQSEKAVALGLRRYLTDLFEIADPALRPDTSITASEILRVGREQAVKRLSSSRTSYAEVLSLIGELYTKVGDFDSAIEVHNDVLKTLPASMDALRSENLLDLAKAQFEVGRFDEAKANLEEALDTRTSISGHYHEQNAEILNVLSEIAVELDDIEMADSLLEDAIEISRRSSPDDQLLTAKLLHQMGTIQRHFGNVDGAEKALRRSLEIYETAGDALALQRAEVLNSLAVLYVEAGRIDEGGDALHASEEIVSQRLGEGHPRYGILLLNMSVLIDQIVGSDSANVLIEKAIQTLRRSRGAHHPDVAVALNHLGVQMRKAGKFAAAESLYTQSIGIAAETLSPQHLLIARTRHNLAILFRIQGRTDAAMNMYMQVVAGYEQVGPRADIRRASALNGLGKTQRDLGLKENAVKSFRQSLEIRSGLLDPTDWRLGTAHSFLGEALADIGQTKEAEYHLRKGVEILTASRGPLDPKTIDAVDRLNVALNGELQPNPTLEPAVKHGQEKSIAKR